MVGRIFNIQRFSVHDGPGIRTTVFVKGCNLRCAWCHNPESFYRKKQIQFSESKCVECGACGKVCPKGIYVHNKKRMHAERCIACEKCTDVCFFGGVTRSGEDKTVEEVMKILLRDKGYYENSGGGMTVSGGEPLLQAEFVAKLMQAAKAEGLHTALDTAANVAFECFEKVLPYTDLILLDLKIMDPSLHKQYTGSSNEKILENAQRLWKLNIPIHIRVPLMKGINDTVKNAKALADFLKDATPVKEVSLLPYHNMGIGKGQGLSIFQEEYEAPDVETMNQLKQILQPWIRRKEC